MTLFDAEHTALFGRPADGPSRLLVAGGRQFDDAALMKDSILDAIDAYSLGLEVTVVHGNARGADRLAGAVARKLGLTVEPHGANWDGPCRAAKPASRGIGGRRPWGPGRSARLPGTTGTNSWSTWVRTLALRCPSADRRGPGTPCGAPRQPTSRCA